MCTKLTLLQVPGGPGITSLTLRSVAVGRLVRTAASQNEVLRRLDAGLPVGPVNTTDGRVEGPSAGSDEELQLVATTYRLAYLCGEPPVEAVAERLDVARSTANKKVIRARALGLLRPRPRGKRGLDMASVNRLPGGGWQVRWKTPDRQSRKKNFDRKPDAERFRTSVEHTKAIGHYVDPSSGRVDFESWSRRWLATTVGLRASTRERDRGYLERYVLPTFGACELADIEFLMVSEWLASLSARGLAPATVVKAHQILAKIMRSAVQARRIPASPCDGVDLPKVERIEMQFLSPTEVATLAEAMDRRYSAAVLVGAYGGLRAGELFGLRADRVDLLRRTVDVAEIVTEVGGSLVFGPPKTRAGRRRVPIPPFVAEALAYQLANGGAKDRWASRLPRMAPCGSGCGASVSGYPPRGRPASSDCGSMTSDILRWRCGWRRGRTP